MRVTPGTAPRTLQERRWTGVQAVRLVDKAEFRKHAGDAVFI